jgi:predicted Zn-dependent protease
MVIGDRPETGVFVDDLFIHPVLGFEMRFPKGWLLQNSNQAVGAMAPRREAAVYLTGDLPAGDLVQVADDFTKKTEEEARVKLTEKKRVRVGSVDAIRYGYEGGPIAAKVTFFPFAGATWRMVGIVPRAASDRYLGPILLSMRSFGPLTDEHRALVHTNRLRIVLARPGEDIVALAQRNRSILDPAANALLNGLLGNEIFQGGELMKVIRRED